MRKLFIAGNWKMNLNALEAKELASGLAQQVTDDIVANVDVAVCPTFVYLHQVAQALADSKIDLGAQNVYFESNGAFTGEISVAMLKDMCCRFVILGHSERRHIMGETDSLINQKLKAALAGALDPIFCIGELLEEREANQTEAVLERQVRDGLADITPDQMRKITVAYEPVWAIGTGKTATPDQAQQAHAFVRNLLTNIYDASLARDIRIQYGGSVKPGNAAELLGKEDVDGALVGGASLKVDDFMVTGDFLRTDLPGSDSDRIAAKRQRRRTVRSLWRRRRTERLRHQNR
jgi:triosephosphate isomerase